MEDKTLMDDEACIYSFVVVFCHVKAALPSLVHWFY